MQKKTITEKSLFENIKQENQNRTQKPKADIVDNHSFTAEYNPRAKKEEKKMLVINYVPISVVNDFRKTAKQKYLSQPQFLKYLLDKAKL